MLTLEGRFRSTFWRFDSKGDLYVRLFDCEYSSVEEQDSQRAIAVKSEASLLEEVHGDAVRAWLRERGPLWRQARPPWLTDAWVAALPASFAAALEQLGIAGAVVVAQRQQRLTSLALATLVLMTMLSYFDTTTDVWLAC